MTISSHLTTFAGMPVVDYDPDKGLGKRKHTTTVFRIGGLEYGEAEQPFSEQFDRFLNEPGTDDITALVIGAWHYENMMDGSTEVVDVLVAARDRVPNLRALFYGDITVEECEISWIVHGDILPLFTAYPKLEEFRIRGAGGLSLNGLRHKQLRVLAIESGGMPATLIGEVLAAELPKLEHLELWLGEENYGGIADPEPLKPLLEEKRFPKLRYLGLRNSRIADEVAKAAANAPILKRIKELDLSLGNLGDEGARALAASKLVGKLKKLDIHHHYVSDEVVAELEALGIELDASDQKKPDRYGDEEYRYIYVAE
jgi:hypothetical protein